jgi:hypothetical protein
MTSRIEDEGDEAPLDPAVERIQAKLRRMILFSGATLGIGVLAVIVAIIFRVSNLSSDRRPAGEPWRSTVELPAGATISSTAIDGDRIAITLESQGSREIHVFDMPSGRSVGTVTLMSR